MNDDTQNPAVESAPAAVADLSALELLHTPQFRWYHLEDPSSSLLDQLAQACQFHELEVEDCRHAGQRAKMEEYEDHVFVIANTLHLCRKR